MKIGKVEKLSGTLLDQTECAIHIIILKEALNHGSVLKRVHRIIKFNSLVKTIY